MSIFDAISALASREKGELGAARQGCQRLILEMGFFFDGTGNNRFNVGIKGTGGSYNNGLSNVARLYELYRLEDVKTAGGIVHRRRQYLQGIGTRAGADDRKITQGIGEGETGVEDRVFEAFETLAGRIPGYDEVTLDVFGFSRGAAAARHFANAVRDRQLTYARLMSSDKSATLVGPPVKIRFLGLFDTVASNSAVGVLRGGASVGALNLDLDAGVASTIFHMTARNEFRKNFPLHRVIPGGGEEKAFPGAHSDIGGGYLKQRETVRLSRPQQSEPRFKRAAVEQERDALIAKGPPANERGILLDEGWIDDASASRAHKLVAGPVKSFSVPFFPMPYTDYAFTYWTELDREVSDGLQKVMVRVMHRRARAAGAPLKPIPGGAEFDLPVGLKTYAANPESISSVAGAELRAIIRDHAHHSSHYNLESRTFGFVYPMAPTDNRERRVWLNTPAAGG